MKKCDECKINVLTDRITCPLCFKTLKDLDGIEYDRAYPKLMKKDPKKKLFYKIILFLLIIASAISILINYLSFNESYWSLFVVFSSIYFYILLRNIILSHDYVIKRLFVQMLITSIIVYVFDRLSGNFDWALAYAIPCIIGFSNIVITLLTIINKNEFSRSFNSQMGGLLIGVIPFILQLIGLIKSEYLWAPLVSCFISLGILLALFIFMYQETIEEFKKRFHL